MNIYTFDMQCFFQHARAFWDPTPSLYIIVHCGICVTGFRICWNIFSTGVSTVNRLREKCRSILPEVSGEDPIHRVVSRGTFLHPAFAGFAPDQRGAERDGMRAGTDEISATCNVEMG